MNHKFGAMKQARNAAYDRAGVECGAPPQTVAQLSMNDATLRNVLGQLRDRTVA